VLKNTTIRKEDPMLWTTAVVLIILWMLGLGTGWTMGSFIHILYAAAVALLVVSLSQEVMINRKLKHASRSRGPKPDRLQTPPNLSSFHS
jgi:hypothetical protein